MGFKKKLLELGTAALIGLNSLFPTNIKASDDGLENRINPMGAISENLSEIPYLPNLLRTYSNWYLTDFLMLAVHEQGHYNEGYRQHLNPSLDLSFLPFWINGRVNYEYLAKNRGNEAIKNIAGFKNVGTLAEFLKNDIFMGNVSEDEIKFKSMLALILELNLPFYIGQHYLGTAPDGNDIENFTKNSGISPETMAISSGVHMLVNAPYFYYLTKNILNSNPKILKPKPYFLSFRYDGDAYMLYLHLDIDKI